MSQRIAAGPGQAVCRALEPRPAQTVLRGACAAGVAAPAAAGLAGADSWSAFPNPGSREKHALAARESRPERAQAPPLGPCRRAFPPGTSRWRPPAGRQPPHPPDVRRQERQAPLAPRLGQVLDAEAPEAHRLLDPAVRRLREPLALGVAGLALRRRQLLIHAARGRAADRVGGGSGPAVLGRRHARVRAARIEIGELRLVAASGVGWACFGMTPNVGFTSSRQGD